MVLWRKTEITENYEYYITFPMTSVNDCSCQPAGDIKRRFRITSSANGKENTNTNDFIDSPTQGFQNQFTSIKITIRLLKLQLGIRIYNID